MARPRKKHFSDKKASIISQIIETYDVNLPKDIHDALKELLGGTTQEMLENELDAPIAESTAEDPECSNSCCFCQLKNGPPFQFNFGPLFLWPEARK